MPVPKVNADPLFQRLVTAPVRIICPVTSTGSIVKCYQSFPFQLFYFVKAIFIDCQVIYMSGLETSFGSFFLQKPFSCTSRILIYYTEGNHIVFRNGKYSYVTSHSFLIFDNLRWNIIP